MRGRAPQRSAARAAAHLLSPGRRFELLRQSRALPRGARRHAVLLRRRGLGARRHHQARPPTVSARAELARPRLESGLDGGRQFRLGHPPGRRPGPVDRLARARDGETARAGHSDGSPEDVVRSRRSARVMMHGLVLAGGRGSRLAAEGVETPKAWVEVAGRPQIVHLVETFTDLGCESITCMVRDGVPVDLPAPAIVRTCRTPSSLHTLVAGLAIVPPGPVFCAMVDTVMPAPDWQRVYRGVTDRLANRSISVLAVTPFVDDELPLYVTRNAEGLATAILDTPPPPPGQLLVTGGVYGLSPEARRLATVAV